MNGQELAINRKRLGFTQASLGQRLGHHQVTIANWEKREAPVPAHVSAYIEAEIGRRDAEARAKA